MRKRRDIESVLQPPRRAIQIRGKNQCQIRIGPRLCGLSNEAWCSCPLFTPKRGMWAVGYGGMLNLSPSCYLFLAYVRWRSLLKEELCFKRGQQRCSHWQGLEINRGNASWHGSTALHPLPLSLITTMISFHLSAQKKLCVIIQCVTYKPTAILNTN